MTEENTEKLIEALRTIAILLEEIFPDLKIFVAKDDPEEVTMHREIAKQSECQDKNCPGI